MANDDQGRLKKHLLTQNWNICTRESTPPPQISGDQRRRSASISPVNDYTIDHCA
jgi:hypothetical protein